MTRPRVRAASMLAFWGLLGAVAFAFPALALPLGLGLAAALAAYVWLARTWFRGRVALRRGRWDEAIALFRRFEEERVTSAFPLPTWTLHTSDGGALAANNVGVAHLSAGRPGEAVAALEEAVSRDPEYALPHLNLAVAPGQLGDGDRARAHAARAVALGLDGAAVERALARALAAANVRIGAALR